MEHTSTCLKPQGMIRKRQLRRKLKWHLMPVLNICRPQRRLAEVHIYCSVYKTQQRGPIRWSANI